MPVSTVFNPPLSEKKKDMHRFPCRFWREGRRNSQSLRIYMPIMRFPSSPPSIKTDFFDLSLLNQSGKTKSAHLYSQDFFCIYTFVVSPSVVLNVLKQVFKLRKRITYHVWDCLVFKKGHFVCEF